jgi:hypothetical protein
MREVTQMKIYEVTFSRNGDCEVHNFWENSQSSVEKFIENMTKRGDLVFVSKKLVKEI